jgi:hypothetical protein
MDDCPGGSIAIPALGCGLGGLAWPDGRSIDILIKPWQTRSFIMQKLDPLRCRKA